MLNKEKSTLAFIVAGGIICLVIAMGIGRFAYTPLLPIMQEQFLFGQDVGGIIASVNYLGYLLGAILCRHRLVAGKRTLFFRLSMITCIVSTGAMGVSSSISYWLGVRFLAGLASAVTFVLGSMIVLARLAAMERMHLSGAVYSGVGFGIALSGWIVPVLNNNFSVQGVWFGLAVISLLLAIVCWQGVVDSGVLSARRSMSSFLCPGTRPTFLKWLTAAYFCEGLGYIVCGTFLVTMVQDFSGASTSGNQAWIIVGLSAALSTFLWSAIAKRTGFLPALLGAYLLQSIGIVLPVISPDTLGTHVGACLFGGTFMGITTLSLSMGRMIDPRPDGRIIGTLTVVYSVGQIIGPTLAGVLASRMGNFNFPLVMAAAFVAIGAALVAIGGMAAKNDSNATHLFSNPKLKGEEHAVCKY